MLTYFRNKLLTYLLTYLLSDGTGSNEDVYVSTFVREQ